VTIPAASPDAVTLTLTEVGNLARKALLKAGTAPANAESVVRSIVAAEEGGWQSHGLMRLPAYCDHVLCGKVDGRVEPELSQSRPAAIVVDAKCGFAHPAIDKGLKALGSATRTAGVAALAVTNSYNCGVVGYHVEALTREGLIGLAFVNAPATIAPWGGRTPFFGTNPIAFACPYGPAPIVIDQSSSVVARGEIQLRMLEGKKIPKEWGFDAAGNPTDDPGAVMNGGSLAPSGGYKGTTLALMVEVLAAVLTGATFSHQASPFAGNEGGPPRVGQFFIAIDPTAFGGQSFAERIAALSASMLAQDGVRLPGLRRAAVRERTAREGISISRKLFDDLAKRAA
jgi:(2R)-3-sulfolactate dehydrogenase (NADP+)